MKRIREFLGTMLLLMMVMFVVLAMVAAGHAQSYIDATSGFLKTATFAASAARTTNSNSSVVDVGAYGSGELIISATANTGTNPTLAVTFSSCPDTTYSHCALHTTAPIIAATGYYRVPLSNFGRYVAVGWTFGGTSTPGYTFAVIGNFKPMGAATASDGASSLDPCASPAVEKNSVKYAVSTAVTTLMVDAAAGKKVYVCGYAVVNHTAAVGTIKFIYGTKVSTDCDTGPADLTGVMDLPSTVGGALIFGSGTQAMKPVPAANQLCIVNTGTSGLNGVITYVQQ